MVADRQVFSTRTHTHTVTPCLTQFIQTFLRSSVLGSFTLIKAYSTLPLFISSTSSSRSPSVTQHSVTTWMSHRHHMDVTVSPHGCHSITMHIRTLSPCRRCSIIVYVRKCNVTIWMTQRHHICMYIVTI